MTSRDMEIRAALYPLQRQAFGLQGAIADARIRVQMAERALADRQAELAVLLAQEDAAEAALVAAADRYGVEPGLWADLGERDWWRGEMEGRGS